MLKTTPLLNILKNHKNLSKLNLYASNAQSFFGEQLALKTHTHSQYASKDNYTKNENYFTDKEGYCYSMSQSIGGISAFAPRFHQHNNYVVRGSTIKQAMKLGSGVPSDWANATHNHDGVYATRSSTFSNANMLDNYIASNFALADHNHDESYYKKDDTVTDTDYLVTTSNKYLSSKDLAKYIHYHSEYISSIEADTMLLDNTFVNSMLFNTPSGIMSTQKLSIITTKRTSEKFGDPEVTWNVTSESGTQLPAALNQQLVKLSSYSLHMGITPPVVRPLDLSDNSLSVSSDNGKSWEIIETYVAAGRISTILLPGSPTEPPFVIDISNPPIENTLKIAHYFTLAYDSSLSKWVLYIYQYHVEVTISNKIRMVVIY